MFRIVLLVLALGLSACGQSAEGKARQKAYSDACLQGNAGACQVLAAWGKASAEHRAAAMQNFTTATGNAANWAVQQQGVQSYSGYGGGSTCSYNSLTGQRFCY